MTATFDEWASRRTLTRAQASLTVLAIAVVAAGFCVAPLQTGGLLIGASLIAYLTMAAWRVLLIAVPRRAVVIPDSLDDLPHYTILVALLDEAAVLGQLVERIGRIDYPADRLEAFLLLEAHDKETIDAALQADRPAWMQVLIVPEGWPTTKPRALNFGLSQARGTLITVFDAEDDPDPLQLREAAQRFAQNPAGRLAALQAPLRIRVPARSSTPFMDRQFAVEYASLFEVALPALAALGLPFPMGGTSNHFRADRLRQVGGWDAHNVTEDADLGFRLWRAGYVLGVMDRPTYEPPPGGLHAWLPQRTRWLKGFMQTFGVHSRSIRQLGWRGGVALLMMVAAPLLAAAVHAVSIAWLEALILVAAVSGLDPRISIVALTVMALGVGTACLSAWLGARRAGTPYDLRDMLFAPFYWSLLTLAFGHALVRLFTEPFAWNKTRHLPDAVDLETGSGAADAGRRAA